ncbi:MAG: hypothetical protein HQ582_03875 [Planctomycetes bacterium]|nr:hypothetical protein [Planctomycetota bacterium]
MQSFRDATKAGYWVATTKSGQRYIPCRAGFIKSENGKFIAVLGAYSVDTARLQNAEHLGGIVVATFDDLRTALESCEPKRIPYRFEIEPGFYNRILRYFGDTKGASILLGEEQDE